MTVASSAKKKGRSWPRLSPEKGNELLGLLLVSLGLLLLLSLASFDPRDPSLLHHVSGEPDIANWIGPFGADLASVLLALGGLAAFLVPVALLLVGVRRLTGRKPREVFGRGLGLLVLLAALPALLQLTLGRLAWRGGAVDSGGVFGIALAEALEGWLHFTGALLVLLSTVVIGATLVIQSTLGEVLLAWSDRLRALIQRIVLARARRRERKAKDRARRRVVAKHMERARERQSSTDGPKVGPLMEAGEAPPSSQPLDLPLKVQPRQGEKEHLVRRVRASDLPPQGTGEAGGSRAGGEASEDGKTAPKQLALTRSAVRGPLPPLSLLQLEAGRRSVDEDALVRLGETIRSRCAEFGVEGSVEGISPGPVITVYEFQPAPGVKVSQIVNLQDDLALALKAESVRIERLAGRSTLGIEVPNETRDVIRLGNLLSDPRFRKSPSILTLALGKTIHGEPYYADLATMPHLLVAGATGSGKSVGLQSMITSVLYRATRDEVKFIFIDPKRIELGVYKDIPHLAAEVVVNPKKAANALLNMVAEMERRYRLLAEVHVRSIAYYNRAIKDPEVKKRLALADDESEVTAEDLKPLPYYVIVIDELADLMTVASSDVETAIARLAQMARAVGIHLIVATQRPSVDVLTGTIKANFPCRIAYATATRHDSRTILDQVGAEKLLGRGDMLFMPPGSSRIRRLHGGFVTEQETAGLVRWLKKQGSPDYDPELLKAPEGNGASGDIDDADDELYDEAARLVVSEGQGSASFLQRRLRVGFSRASRLIDMMERDGILGPPQGSKPRDVLVKADFFEEIDAAREGVEA